MNYIYILFLIVPCQLCLAYYHSLFHHQQYKIINFNKFSLQSTSGNFNNNNHDNTLKKKHSHKDRKLIKTLESINNSRSILSNNMLVKIEDDPLIPMVEKVVIAADMRKAASISALRVMKLTEVTQFMILIEGFNNRQNQAIALSIEEEIREKFGESPYMKEGTAASGWIVLDYGSMIAHIMSPQMKNFYKLEKRWVGAEVLDVGYLLTPTSADGSRQSSHSAATTIKSSASTVYLDEDAAFWGDDLEEQNKALMSSLNNNTTNDDDDDDEIFENEE